MSLVFAGYYNSIDKLTVTHPTHDKNDVCMVHTTRESSPTLFDQQCGFFYIPLLPFDQWKEGKEDKPNVITPKYLLVWTETSGCLPIDLFTDTAAILS